MEKLNLREGGSIRTFSEDGKRVLEVLAAPYGSPIKLDRLKQYFSPNTDFMTEIGRQVPLLYGHGYSPLGRTMDKPKSIGTATVSKIDEKGVWMKAELDDSQLSDLVWESALDGSARASTGSMNYLERHNKTTGEVLTWALSELSLFKLGDKMVPVSDDAVVLMPVRALFTERNIDYPFEGGEHKEDEAIRQTKTNKKDNIMNEIEQAVADALEAREIALASKEAEKVAMRAQIEADMKGDEKYLATFNIGGKESKRQLDADSEESENFYWNMTHPLQAPRAVRVLEETQALEGGPLIPLPVYNKIVGLKDEYSLISKMGITKMYTDSLTLRIPRENSGMGVFAAIDEEGPYIENEPAFETVTATMVKRGSMISITEEMLEDTSIFEPYFIKLVARKWALTENLELYTKLAATDTEGASTGSFTAAEIDAYMFSMTEPWAENAQILMNQEQMGLLRALTSASTRDFGDFPAFSGREFNTLYGKKVWLNSNFPVTGDTGMVMTMVDPDAIAYVERRGLNIKVDPYGDALNGRVRYFPSYRADCEVIQVLGNVSYIDT